MNKYSYFRANEKAEKKQETRRKNRLATLHLEETDLDNRLRDGFDLLNDDDDGKTVPVNCSYLNEEY